MLKLGQRWTGTGTAGAALLAWIPSVLQPLAARNPFDEAEDLDDSENFVAAGESKELTENSS